jgi:DNA repair protein RadC
MMWGKILRSVFFLVVMTAVVSCSLSPKPNNNSNNPHEHSLRRADYGKYMLEEAPLAGTRTLFIQPDGKNCLNSSKAVSNYLTENFHEKGKDAALFILLDGKNRVLSLEEIEPITFSDPSLCSSLVLQRAVDESASSVILVQYLATRTSTPYNYDREITKKLKLSLDKQEVALLDHFILSRTDCFSFADRHLLQSIKG